MDCARRQTKNLNWTIPLPDKANAHRRSDDEKEIELVDVNPSESPSSSSTSSSDEDSEDTSSSDSHHSDQSEKYSGVIQITDIHVDPYYTPGSNAACGEPLCCRKTNGMGETSEKSAGAWGDYRNCDTPVNTLRNALKHISDKHPNVS